METSLTPEIFALLEKVRVAYNDDRLADAAVHMREVRRLVNENKTKEVSMIPTW